jgi:hypothetical protein
VVWKERKEKEMIQSHGYTLISTEHIILISMTIIPCMDLLLTPFYDGPPNWGLLYVLCFSLLIIFSNGEHMLIFYL